LRVALTANYRDRFDLDLCVGVYKPATSTIESAGYGGAPESGTEPLTPTPRATHRGAPSR
jgi:hypothetical protein